MLKRTLTAAAIAMAAVSAQADPLLTENFDDSIIALAGRGWVLINLSSPVGPQESWFQGNPAVFAAQAGEAGSYLAANYENAADGGTLNNWVISPTFSTATAGTISFWARAEILEGFSDRISYSFAAGSLPDPAAFSGGTEVTLTGEWTRYTLDFDAQGVGSSGRFAINYFGSQELADYIGVDTVSVAAIPEPSTWLLLGFGLAAVAGAARRQRPMQR